MMSVLAVNVFAFGRGAADAQSGRPEYAAQINTAGRRSGAAAAAISKPLLLEHPTTRGHTATLAEFDRGDLIRGFDPDIDILELEYCKSLATPEITVLDFANGTGASVALNGVVIANLPGVEWLDAADIKLIAT